MDSTVDKSGRLNVKSDVEAKREFCNTLKQRGYSNVRIAATPVDVLAELDGKQYLFEIKYTRSNDRYFGAATLTEWTAAIDNPECFRFVIAWQGNGSWSFEEYTVDEFMQYSYIPPFKIFFNLPIGPKGKPSLRPSRRVNLTLERLALLRKLFLQLRADS